MLGTRFGIAIRRLGFRRPPSGSRPNAGSRRGRTGGPAGGTRRALAGFGGAFAIGVLPPQPSPPAMVAGGAPPPPADGSRWWLENDGQPVGVPDADVDAARAWAVTTGDPSVVVAIVDSGVDVTHPQLAGAILVNEGEIPGNALDDDGNGYADDATGWDFADGDADVLDPFPITHGTLVAGLVAGETTGLAPGVRLLPVKVFSDSGSDPLFEDAAAEGIAYALDRGARVIQIAWELDGAPGTALEAALQAAEVAGAVVVVAAGNAGQDLDGAPVWPASHPEAITVAGTDRYDRFVDLGPLFTSAAGPQTVELAAPTEKLVSTLPGGGENLFTGTSAAAPLVAAAVALVLSVDPSLTPAEVRAILAAGADPLPSLEGRVAAGRLNAGNAVLLATAQAAPALRSLRASAAPTSNDPLPFAPSERSESRSRGFAAPRLGCASLGANGCRSVPEMDRCAGRELGANGSLEPAGTELVAPQAALSPVTRAEGWSATVFDGRASTGASETDTRWLFTDHDDPRASLATEHRFVDGGLWPVSLEVVGEDGLSHTAHTEVLVPFRGTSYARTNASPHPYPPGFQLVTVNVPGANALRLHFTEIGLAPGDAIVLYDAAQGGLRAIEGEATDHVELVRGDTAYLYLLGYAGGGYGFALEGVDAAFDRDANRPPSLRVDGASAAVPGTPVSFAAAATDPEDDAVTLRWRLMQRPGGSEAALSATEGEAVTLIPDRHGNYAIAVTASDGVSETSTLRWITTRGSDDHEGLGCSVGETRGGSPLALLLLVASAMLSRVGITCSTRHRVREALPSTCSLPSACAVPSNQRPTPRRGNISRLFHRLRSTALGK